MGVWKAYLEVQDDVPDKVKNSRWDAISNTRGINSKQLHLRDEEGGDIILNQVCQDWKVSALCDMSKQCNCINVQTDTLTCLSSRKARALEMLFSLKMRWEDDLNLYS